MKIQLDTENKTIKLENDVLLSDLVKVLNKILPNGEWKTFTLQTHTTINHWHEPVIIHEHPRPYHYPWYFSMNKQNADVRIRNTEMMELKSDSMNLSLNKGVYNIEA